MLHRQAKQAPLAPASAFLIVPRAFLPDTQAGHHGGFTSRPVQNAQLQKRGPERGRCKQQQRALHCLIRLGGHAPRRCSHALSPRPRHNPHAPAASHLLEAFPCSAWRKHNRSDCRPGRRRMAAQKGGVRHHLAGSVCGGDQRPWRRPTTASLSAGRPLRMHLHIRNMGQRAQPPQPIQSPPCTAGSLGCGSAMLFCSTAPCSSALTSAPAIQG